jgi:hypothetical protein
MGSTRTGRNTASSAIAIRDLMDGRRGGLGRLADGWELDKAVAITSLLRGWTAVGASTWSHRPRTSEVESRRRRV